MSNNSTLADRYMGRNEDQLLEEWFDALHRQKFGIGYNEATGVISDLRAEFALWCDESIRRRICHDWQYCVKLKSLGRTAALVAATTDFIAELTGFPTHGACAVAVLFVTYGSDSLCSCPG